MKNSQDTFLDRYSYEAKSYMTHLPPETPPPVISVIVPVYNAAPYLRRCLDSLILQSFAEIEIIVINDGSTDDSQSILDEYAAKDSRIRLIAKANEGMPKARNVGITHSRGTYISFMDSDDWASPEMLEMFYRFLTDSQYSSVLCPLLREYPNRTSTRLFDLPELTLYRDGEEYNLFCRRLVGPLGPETQRPELLNAFAPACGKLYTAQTIKDNQLSFEDHAKIGPSEDLLFNIQYYLCSNSVAILNRPLYHYWRGDSKSISFTHRPKLLEQWSVLFRKLRAILEEESLDADYYIALEHRIALSVIDLGLNILSYRDGSLLLCLQRLKVMLSTPLLLNALKTLDMSYLPIHWKFFFLCAKHRFVWPFYVLLKAIAVLRKYY